MALFLLAFTTGCASEPFTRPPLPLLTNPNPPALRDAFLNTLPSRRFTLDSTVIIQAPFRDDLAVLGELVVDRPADRFVLVGLTHMGVTLFKLSGDHNGTTIDSAIPQLMEKKDVLLSMGTDIRRMFFDPVPGDAAKAAIGKTTVCFSEKTPDGTLVYEFGGDPAVLLEKRMDGFFGAVWRVRYYDYASEGPEVYPRGVVMDNSQFHYRIIVKNRAMQ